MSPSRHWKTLWELYRGVITAKTWRYSAHSLRELSLRMLSNWRMIFNLCKSMSKSWSLKRLFSLVAKITLSSILRELFSKSLSNCTINYSKIPRLTKLFKMVHKISWSTWRADSQGNPFNFLKRLRGILCMILIKNQCPKTHHWVKLCKTKLINEKLIKKKLKRLWWQTNAVILKFSNFFASVHQSKN